MTWELIKTLHSHRELRYSLTNQCNFKCIFCHNEGLGHEKNADITDEKVAAILDQAVHLGYGDITFTGGEPLLKKARLAYLVDHFSRHERRPDLTLVTNASRLDREIIDCLARYPGKRKVNLSLHATDEKTFKQVTGVTAAGMFQKVQENILMTTESGIPVKMNHVILRDINHDKIQRAVELAYSLGASAVKFLELLVLPENPDDYSMYYELSAITKQIEQVAGNPKRLSPRQLVYQYGKDPGFKIELQQCTCAVGCSLCREVRAKTFSSDMRYHPCFVRSNKYYGISEPGDIGDALKKGDRIINGYALKYKDASPTLIQTEQMVPGKKEFFFRIIHLEDFQDFLKQKNFRIEKKTGFHLEYYWPSQENKAWKSFRHVLKLGWDHHNKAGVDMILTDHEYVNHPGIGLETVTTYLDSSGPLKFESKEAARHFIKRISFMKYMECEWEIETWAYRDLSINLSFAQNCSTAKIQGSMEKINTWLDIFNLYDGGIEALMEPLESLIYKINMQPVTN